MWKVFVLILSYKTSAKHSNCIFIALSISKFTLNMLSTCICLSDDKAMSSSQSIHNIVSGDLKGDCCIYFDKFCSQGPNCQWNFQISHNQCQQ